MAFVVFFQVETAQGMQSRSGMGGYKCNEYGGVNNPLSLRTPAP